MSAENLTATPPKTDATPASLGYRMPAEWEPHEATWLSWPRPDGISFPDSYDRIVPTLAQMVHALSGSEKVNINVCEHPEPVAELRRIYDTASETLGFRKLEQFAGRDVLALKLMLHALGYYRAGEKAIPLTGPGANVYTEEAVKALDAFRSDQEWGTTVPGFVDARVIDRLWLKLKERGKDEEIRRQLLGLYRLR